MNEKVLSTLEYEKVKSSIEQYLTTRNGKKELAALSPVDNPNTINMWLDETDDGAHILRLDKEISIPKLDDVTPYMKRLKIDASLNGSELSKINKILKTSNYLVRFFNNLKDDEVSLNRLYKLINDIQAVPSISQRLSDSIDDDGRLLNTASKELNSIRRRMDVIKGEVRSIMNQFTQKHSKDLTEPIVTIREDRMVLPVKAENKNKFGGIVHDRSSSGQTLYIEPASTVGLNTELRQKQIEERHEERRILIELSDLIRPYQSEIINNSKILGHLDLINAKAKYARDLKATRPVVSNENHVNLKQARHPLIDMNKVVANDLYIGKDNKAIIITGPNTGGKTITIKTLGLLQLMAQSGLFVTANEGSSVAVFDNVFADIGDEQSIEQNLSTFSSHMDNIVDILNGITKKSLVILDELGAGTDPKEGSALAIAILDKIAEKDCDVVATTHYPELKVYAYNRPQTINASMEFDSETLQPTYHLMMGVPGQSNGLNIASRLGLDESIITEARSLVDQDSQDLNTMIVELTEQTKRARVEADELKVQLGDATKLHEDLSEAYAKYKNQKDRLVTAAKQQANEIAEAAKKKADAIIKDLHEKQRKVGQVTIKENELIDAQGQLNSLRHDVNLVNNRVLKKAKAKHDFHKGDDVMVKSYGQRGVLVKKLDDNEWEVQLGILKMRIAEGDLEKIKVDNDEQRFNTKVKRTASKRVSAKLDLRGHRYEEAMHEVDQYLDSAVLAGYPSVTIIHGKGTGALRQGVTDMLSSDRRVDSFNYSPANAGGDGSTVVKLK
ncbi:Endonuclease MutS2 [Apilactobacillus kunkeei]|uniref:Endonuclease MutS2 n=1 Tax=Apilactobacillus kunkeei EFB6 TaxID=1419324 RepID=A0A837ADY7_9LACO|nr:MULTISPECIES: endonuclease MutS2 [Apilactobacillus]KDB01044.1 mismatch repair ATPase (MutS family) [Apilactobacillus kunkeei EFB6]MCK8618047.1 endonuclease MutS2 [Apilactobacillus kunkeei]MDN2612426.1 endonuclease MutS2 [Apilactobacillus sp. EABW-1NA]TPR50908.1 endonuclease MutS2 [Apilactobacillus kunkeei]UZX33725.1 endonuclease MutS2 [Apilactobacillus kunkeei]